MKVLEWNINKRSSNECVKPFVFNKILKEDADIVCLVEYTNDDGILNSLAEKYWLFESDKMSGNQVLLGIKKTLSLDMPIVVRKTDEPNCYNFLHIRFKINNSTWFSVIGLRMLTGSREKSIKAAIQTPPLKAYINKYIKEPFIILGDFNILEARMKEKWFPENEGYKIQDCIDICKNSNGICKCSFFFTDDNGYINGKGALDHILYQKPVSVQASYKWDFVTEDDIYPDLDDLNIGSLWRIKPPYPDHAMLVAEVSLNYEE